MTILIPMAGAGQRFVDAGYTTHKPVIPVTCRKTGRKLPMVVSAISNLPGANNTGNKIVLIDRDFHKYDGTEDTILEYIPEAIFITTDRLTEGQACTCLLAKEMIANDNELLIASCDNGMVIDEDRFNIEKQSADILVFTYRNNEAVLKNPFAYGWCIIDNSNNIKGVSVKKTVSDNPLEDHVIVATFWFKKGSDFVRATNKMIHENDRVKNEFYVDQVIKHAIDLGLKAKVFEIERYIGWGTPYDYETYENTIMYWKGFQNTFSIF